MDDFAEGFHKPQWEAGFEADRSIVVAQLGPYRKVFQRPKRYRRKFFHVVHELPIEDWIIPVDPPQFGPICTVEVELSLRFQATFRYAREHLDKLGDLGGYIRASYLNYLKDAAEQELRVLESVEWLDRGQTALESEIEMIVHELLAIRNIQSRARCRIEIHFGNPEDIDVAANDSQLRHQGIIQELLRRRREKAERLAREEYDRELLEKDLQLEHEERLLEFRRRQMDLERRKLDHESEQTIQKLSTEIERYSEQVKGELRLREERIRHEAQLRQMELDADLAEKDVRSEALDDVENHLRREIELLAMERQRLALEAEINEVKMSRARGTRR